YFFFQAEDGIRAFHVTGVQTCALPIWGISCIGTLQTRFAIPGPAFAAAWPYWPSFRSARSSRPAAVEATTVTATAATPATAARRSEERRVGKECGCGEAQAASTWTARE